jgi:hypothetical protein
MLTIAARLPALPRLERKHLIAAAAAALLVLTLVAASLLWRPAGFAGTSGGRAGTTPPVALSGSLPSAEPLVFRPVAPQDAVAINAATPVAALPNPAARAFDMGALPAADRGRALDCLTAAVYYEAAVESADGQRAVAQVVLNRARHPAYPNSVCGVVYQGAERSTGCQFTFTCDGSLRRVPSTVGWARARAVAAAALGGYVHAPVGWATHYHANYVVPYWSSSLTKLATIGTHIFYRWAGGWGTPRAFTSRYAAAEPNIMQVGDLASELPPVSLDVVAALSVTEVTAESALNPGVLPAAGTAAAPSFRAAVLRPAAPATAPAASAAASAAPAPAAPPVYRSALLRQREAAQPPAPAPERTASAQPQPGAAD